MFVSTPNSSSLSEGGSSIVPAGLPLLPRAPARTGSRPEASRAGRRKRALRDTLAGKGARGEVLARELPCATTATMLARPFSGPQVEIKEALGDNDQWR